MSTFLELEGDPIGRMVGPYRLTTKSLLREGYSDWFGAIGIDSGQPVALRCFSGGGVFRWPELQHPNLARVVGHGVENPDSIPEMMSWYALECELPLRTLEAYARPGLPWEECLDLIDTLAQCLAAAHRTGLCLRPDAAAILITSSGPRILLNEKRTTLISHARKWVPPPFSPQGTPPEEVGFGTDPTPAGDQYRLAAIACYLLTGHWGTREFAPDLPELARKALRRALAPNPTQRFPGVQSLADELRLAIPRGSQELPATSELIEAILAGSWERTHQLLTAGADPNSRKGARHVLDLTADDGLRYALILAGGWTESLRDHLPWAAESNWWLFLQALRRRGINPIPALLPLAAASSNPELIESLLPALTPTDDLRIPLAIAQRAGHTRATELLRKAGQGQ